MGPCGSQRRSEMFRCLSSASVALCAVLALPAVGHAQTAATQPAPAAGGTTDANQDMQATVHTENGRRVYVANTTIEVRGEIQRPYAFSVSGRSSLGYTYFETPMHFIQDILDAVRRAPF